jgi:hypothetical protein
MVRTDQSPCFEAVAEVPDGGGTKAVFRSGWLPLLAWMCLCVAAGAEERQPYQFREPKQFWMHQFVFQKRGIVVEDDDYIVRKRYWVLDTAVKGQVVQVDAIENGLDLTVRFDSMGSGWNTVGINVQNRRVTKTKRTETIRPDAYGDGTNIEVDEVTFSYTVEGEEVDHDRCGLIVRREGGVVFVRFPSSLLSLVSPRVGDRVARSFDWHDGFADGGRQSQGIDPQLPEGCYGIVESERDEKGFIDVRWERTGRRKRHRFDNFGFYDVQLVRPDGDR